jgi:hypothetical protein|tara:strand:+ start:213 stop:692 length:480 start_codon:yes stop_codon:yes gene_type:complete
MKPFIQKKFITKNLLTWKELDCVIKNCDDRDFEVILPTKQKRFGKYSYKNKSIIISNCLKFFDFSFIKQFVDKNKLFKYVNWDAHIYASYTKKSCSFPKHFDYAHNIIIQQKGQSNWIIEDFCNIILEPGDMIYIPYKWKHQCVPTGKRLSLSFPFWIK